MTDTRTPSITALDGPTGIELRDPIEGAQFTILTPRPVDPTPVDPGTFAPPVDAAASVSVTELETTYHVGALVRDADMNIVADCNSSDRTAVEPGEYYVEVSSAKMKLYLHVAGRVVFEPTDDRIALSFPGAATLRIGIRSLHEHPAATIETTSDPESVATAVSHLGSALKTTSCERSFPTLRGHPPLVEVGTELSIPAAVSPPETGVTIEVPPTLDSLYPVSSLAYYLGASVEIGDRPILIADGEPVPLDADDGFERAVERVLKQVFLLDCVTRTEGLYDVPLHEREVVESAVDLDFEWLYDQPIGPQVRRYLDVAYDDVAEAVPKWKLTADVVPEADSLPVLPFLADELAVVRCPEDPTADDQSVDSLSPEVKSVFGRRGTVRRSRSHRDAGSSGGSLDEDVFTPEPSDSIEQTYVGDGIPIGASKMSVAEYYRRLDFGSDPERQIRVIVVCNDPEMDEENAVEETYGTREWLEFDISTYEQLTTAELTDLLEREADFLHYIGHADEEGLRCADGHLDARTLEQVDVNAFLLNACQSYEQGRALVDAGALGGIVTLTDVLNPTATEIGRSIARFLNQGFSLLSMLDLLEKRNRLAQRYMVVGDGNIMPIESMTGSPHAARVEPNGEDEYRVSVTGYPSKHYKLGAITQPDIRSAERYSINSGDIGTYTVSSDELSEFLQTQVFPVILDGQLYWSDEVDREIF
ncbi:hypothetical protein [Halomicrobium salinisoli]|uniref:hypothetical protein n=1 Tax=Halomicrobium salinisoli TaxID=2878391 RepID=UPI001CF09640|nr:hypothetical protein [Halomicrobium salinisoli]